MAIPKKSNNLSNNFESHMDKKSLLKQLNIEKNDINSINKSLNISNYAKNMLSEYIF